jgi:hypothetical protein
VTIDGADADDEYGTRRVASATPAAGLRPVTVIVSEQEIDFPSAGLRTHPKGRPLDRPGAVSAFLSDSVLEGYDAEEAIQKVREASKTGNFSAHFVDRIRYIVMNRYCCR